MPPRAWVFASFLVLVLACRTAHEGAPRDPPPASNPGPDRDPRPGPRPEPRPRVKPVAATGGSLQGPIPDPMQVGAEEELPVLFQTDGWTLVRRVGRCRPVQACTSVLARKPGEPDRRIAAIAELSAIVPAVSNEVEALAFASFLTQNQEALRDFACEQGVLRGGRFDRWMVPDDVVPDPGRVSTLTLGEGGPFEVSRYLGCYTDSDVDRLVLSREEIAADGRYTYGEAEMVYEGRFLPRYR